MKWQQLKDLERSFERPDPLSWLADDECEHGRLPNDRSDPCGCFPQELDDLNEERQ